MEPKGKTGASGREWGKGKPSPTPPPQRAAFVSTLPSEAHLLGILRGVVLGHPQTPNADGTRLIGPTLVTGEALTELHRRGHVRYYAGCNLWGATDAGFRASGIELPKFDPAVHVAPPEERGAPRG
jgi:hypothetical protein